MNGRRVPQSRFFLIALMLCAAATASSQEREYGAMEGVTSAETVDFIPARHAHTWPFLMGATMTFVMLSYTAGMYPSRTANIAIFAGSIVVFGISLWLAEAKPL